MTFPGAMSGVLCRCHRFVRLIRTCYALFDVCESYSGRGTCGCSCCVFVIIFGFWCRHENRQRVDNRDDRGKSSSWGRGVRNPAHSARDARRGADACAWWESGVTFIIISGVGCVGFRG
jgi:hypothetical protein